MKDPMAPNVSLRWSVLLGLVIGAATGVSLTLSFVVVSIAAGPQPNGLLIIDLYPTAKLYDMFGRRFVLSGKVLQWVPVVLTNALVTSAIGALIGLATAYLGRLRKRRPPICGLFLLVLFGLVAGVRP